jgi:ribonuclease T1
MVYSFFSLLLKTLWLMRLGMLFVVLALPLFHADANGYWFETPNLSSIQAHELPAEARETLILIERNGPYPYRRDGVEFKNRERKLPQKPRGYYREYTVPTPGKSGRGAKRIVAGEVCEYYYTTDHYRSFKRIIP